METTRNETETKLAHLDAEVAAHSLAPEPVKAHAPSSNNTALEMGCRSKKPRRKSQLLPPLTTSVRDGRLLRPHLLRRCDATDDYRIL